MKYLLTVLALPLALAAVPAAAQDCVKGDCPHAAPPTQAEAILKARQALAREIEAKKQAAANDNVAGELHGYAVDQRDPCEHGDDCLDAHGVCTECPKVAKQADCTDCADEHANHVKPA